MPIYEYRCEACDQQFERWQRITEEAVKTCPTCGKEVRRLISATSFQLKGTGWYASDYGGKGTGSVSSAAQKADDRRRSGKVAS
jgi:putative FmdB family regulatory protein